MRRRIQRSMALILVLTLVLTMVAFTYVVFNNNVELMKSEVKSQAIYISEGMNIGGIEYLESIKDKQESSRISLIDSDGVVLFDTKADVEELENHIDRDEVLTAINNGEGTATRVSDSIGSQTFYHAIKLLDGKILRVSSTTESVLITVLDVIPSLFMIGVFVFIIAIFLSMRETYKMIQPLNELDLEKPLLSSTYEELTPLLTRIDTSNRSKEEAETLRREFSANVSHELKTPLTSISGYAELMKSGMVKLEDVPGFSQKIYDESNRMVMLIEDIITISQLDEKGIQMEKSEVDAFHIMREICSRLSYCGEKKNVELSITGSSVLIDAVPSILDEMLFNITENALKYNKEGGQVKIWVGSTLEGARVIVQDTGIGIPEDEIERIFERFYRVDKSHSKATGGSGLGLSIVKHAARLHNAEIKVDSVLEEGTKITVDFRK